MRLLANENFPGDAVEALRAGGHDVAWIRTDAPGIRDADVLARAQRESRIVVTFDKDFGELAFRARLPASSGIILFRISTPSAAHVTRVVTTAIESRTDWAGHFSVVEDNRIRMTPLP
jgi:predicted nuclease of predicted toxin-antitoxin system